MSWKLAGYAMWAAKLLMIEMLLPGGTLVVFALLLAGRSSPSPMRRLAALLPFQKKDGRAAYKGDLMACYAVRRLE